LKNYCELLKLIKKLRLQKKISQLYIASKLGSSDEDFYGKIERNEKTMRLFQFAIISRAIGYAPLSLCEMIDIERFTPPHLIRTCSNVSNNSASELIFGIYSKEYLCPYINKSACKNCININEEEFNKSVYSAIGNFLNIRRTPKSSFSESLGISVSSYIRSERECRFLTLPKFFEVLSVLNLSSATVMIEAEYYFWNWCRHTGNSSTE